MVSISCIGSKLIQLPMNPSDNKPSLKSMILLLLKEQLVENVAVKVVVVAPSNAHYFEHLDGVTNALVELENFSIFNVPSCYFEEEKVELVSISNLPRKSLQLDRMSSFCTSDTFTDSSESLSSFSPVSRQDSSFTPEISDSSETYSQSSEDSSEIFSLSRSTSLRSLLSTEDIDRFSQIDNYISPSSETEHDVYIPDEYCHLEENTDILRKVEGEYEKSSVRFILDLFPQLTQIFELINTTGAEVFPQNLESTLCKKENLQTVRKIHQDVLPLDNKTFLIYGKTQSGKTALIQCVSLGHCVLTKCTCLVVISNFRDGNLQLHDRTKEFVENHMKFTNTRNHGVSYLYTSKATEKELEDAFSGKTNKMVVALANESQLGKIDKCISTLQTPTFACCVDESDDLVCGDVVSFRTHLSNILDKSGRTYMTTATTFDLLLTQDRISSSDTIVLTPKVNYKGLSNSVIFNSLKNTAKPSGFHNSFWSNDPQLYEYLKYYSDKNVMGESITADITRPPVITLIKVSHLKKQHSVLSEAIRNDDVLGLVWATIIYNGDGVFIRNPHDSDHIIIGNNVGIERDGGYVFGSLSFKHALQYFYDYQGKGGKVTHIAVISGDLADRGISFVSENYKWHVNHMYYVPSKQANVSHLIQSAGRLTGNFDDDTPLYLWAPKVVNENLKKGIIQQEEFLSRLSQRTGSVTDSYKEITFLAEKMPSKKLGRVAKKFEVSTLEKPDDGQDIQVYRDALVKVRDAEFTSLPLSEACEACELEIEEFDRLTKVMFPRWAKNTSSSKISIFMKELDPLKIYSLRDLKSKKMNITNVQNYSCNSSDTLKKTRGYGVIMKTVDNGYILYPELVREFNTYFNKYP
jgi:hypothetical protein